MRKSERKANIPETKKQQNNIKPREKQKDETRTNIPKRTKKTEDEENHKTEKTQGKNTN